MTLVTGALGPLELELKLHVALVLRRGLRSLRSATGAHANDLTSLAVHYEFVVVLGGVGLKVQVVVLRNVLNMLWAEACHDRIVDVVGPVDVEGCGVSHVRADALIQIVTRLHVELGQVALLGNFKPRVVHCVPI